MSTYSYTIVLDDSEVGTMMTALDFFLDHCKEQLKSGKRAPYLAYERNLTNISKRLFDDVNQVSGNNFHLFNPDGTKKD